MKTNRIILALFFIASTAMIQAQTKAFTSHDVFKLRIVTSNQVSPDGANIAYLVTNPRPFSDGKGSDYNELYVYNNATASNKLFITGKQRIRGLKWAPDSKSVLFYAKMNGEKKGGIWQLPIDGGAAQKFVDINELVYDYKLSADGKYLLYLTKENTVNKELQKYVKMGFDAEIYEENTPHKILKRVNLNNGNTIIYNKGYSIHDFEFSPDGTKIVVTATKENLTDYTYMYKNVKVFDAESGEYTLIIPKHGKMGNLSWSPDGKKIAFVSASAMNDPVAGSLFVVDADKKYKFEDIENLVQDCECSVTHVEWFDNNTLLYTAAESVNSALYSYNLKKKTKKTLVMGGLYIFNSFSFNGDNILSFAGNTPTYPNELIRYRFKEVDLTKLTSFNKFLEEYKFGNQVKLSYIARDGLRIDGVLIYPVDYVEGKKYPLINLIHGGPEASMMNGWQTYYSRWGQTAANRGYFVFMPNYRASSARGVKFSQMDFGDLGDEEFLDVLDGIEHLSDKGLIDKKKVGIGGGSYGGYFAALGSTKYSDHFAASVAFVGISDQISKRNTTDIPYEDYYVHWGFWTNEDVQKTYDASPVKYASNNKTPTLILHGKVDPRVHPSQSLELYRVLKQFGSAPVRLVWYPKEGHGNRMNPARLDYNMRTLEWFDYYLKEEHKKDSKPSSELDYGL